MKKPRVDFIEIVPDAELEEREKEVTEALRKHYPQSGQVKLYRTSDGRVGFQMQVSVMAGDLERLQQAYRAVMKVLGEKRGRPIGNRTVQTKLHLPKPVYSALKKMAKESSSTMSNVVTSSLLAKMTRAT